MFGGKPELILKLFIDSKITVIISEEILTELRRVISIKSPLYKPKLRLLVSSIRDEAIIVPLGEMTIKLNRDADDNKVIETAVIGQADYIISGDEDLLSLRSYQKIGIINPGAFLDIFNQSS